MGASLGNSLDGTGGEGERDGLFQFWHVNAFFLEIRVLPHHSGGVKLSSASPVGVTSTDSGAFL